MMLIPASSDRQQELKESLAEIQARVAAAAPSRTPTLVAVSKLKPAGDILACYEAGHRDFGENYVQELEEKAKILPADIRWHFIGTLQSNKAKVLAAIPNLHSIQTVGSMKAAKALQKAVPADRDAPLGILLQVNTSGEVAKSGLPPIESMEDIDDSELARVAEYITVDCPNLRLEGLMTIGALELSLNASESEKNADFETLKLSRDYLGAYLGSLRSHPWGPEDAPETLLLSMGMSSDFEAALKAGSDIVRVGTGIFGARPPRASAST